MRKLLLSTLLLASASVAMADALTPAQALARLQDAESASDTPRRAPAANLQLQSTVATAETGEPAVYLFSDAEGRLWFVGADDMATPLLGYTDAPVEADNMPPQLKWWLNECASLVGQAGKLKATAKAAAPREGEPALVMAAAPNRAPIVPMLTTAWNQGSPYNNFCPKVDTYTCPTGCTATATAQIVNYYKYPLQGTGEKGYYCNENSSADNVYTGWLELDFSTFTFDWPNMLDRYGGIYNPDQADAVARLMQAIGYLAEMQYGAYASGAATSTAINGLVEYLGYNTAATSIWRSNYGRTIWEQLLYEHLSTVGPVLYAGYGYEAAGHAFVCDGYRDGLYHFNWGWGGAYDGYFSIDALTPEGEGIGGNGVGDFSISQNMCLNITKPENPVVAIPTEPMTLGGNLMVMDSYGTMMANTDQFFLVSNTGSETYSTVVSMIFVDDSGNEYPSSSTYSVSALPPGYGYTKLGFDYPLSLPDGRYHIYICGSINGAEAKRLPAPTGCVNYAVVSKQGATYTFEPVPPIKFTVNNLQLTKDLYFNHSASYSFTLANNAGVEIADGLRAVLFTKNTDGSPCFIATGTMAFHDMLPGESKEISTMMQMAYLAVEKPAEQVYLGLHTMNSDEMLAEIPVEMNDDPGSPSFNLMAFKFKGDANNANALDMPFIVNLRCTTGIYENPFYFYLYPVDGDGYPAAFLLTDPMFFAPGQRIQFPINGEFPDLEIGKSYYAYLFYLSNRSTLTQLNDNPLKIKIASKSGIEIIDDDADAEIVATEVYTLDGRRVAEASAPGLYILRHTMADGSVKVEKVAR